MYPYPGQAPAPYPPPGAGFGPVVGVVAQPMMAGPGYNYGGAGGGFIPPPNPVFPPAPDTQGQQSWEIPALTEEQAREFFKEYVNSECCYQSGPADEGVITSIKAFNTYKYTLETFTEARSSELRHEPFTGQPVDANLQPAPGPWDIPANSTLFQDSSQDIKVPYTSSVKDCQECTARGKIPCTKCAGAGNQMCKRCNGSGHTEGNEPCTTCETRGRVNCPDCKGQGVKDCASCKGKRQLLAFVSLKIQWTNNKSEHLSQQSSGLSAESLGKVSGKEVFKYAQNVVYPVLGFPDNEVVQASDRLVKEHQSKFFQTARVLQQRQTIELIPLTKVEYKWKERIYTYYVYGKENKIKAIDYPETCCCVVM